MAPQEPPVASDVPPPPEGAVVQFGDRLELAQRYVELLASTGVEHGLLGPREVPRLWSRHILNCAVIGELIPHGARVIDIGSGAGLPGIPLALARRDLDVLLVEPLLRRVRWLTSALGELGLSGVAVHRGRAEDLAATQAAEIVTARAVTRLATLGSWCAPAVLPGGRLLALKGSTAQKELTEDRDELLRAGFDELSIKAVGQGVVEPPTIVVECRRALGVGGPSGGEPGSGRRRPDQRSTTGAGRGGRHAPGRPRSGRSRRRR